MATGSTHGALNTTKASTTGRPSGPREPLAIAATVCCDFLPVQFHQHLIFAGNSQTRVEHNQRQWRLSYQTDEIFPLQSCSIDGLKVFCPQQPEEYLRHCYADPSQVPFKRHHPYVLPLVSFVGFLAGTRLLERFFHLPPGRVTSTALALLARAGLRWPSGVRDE